MGEIELPSLTEIITMNMKSRKVSLLALAVFALGCCSSFALAELNHCQICHQTYDSCVASGGSNCDARLYACLMTPDAYGRVCPLD